MKKFRRIALLLAVVGVTANQAWAQTYPSKPLRIVVPFPAGGTVDTVARAFGQKITESWKQPVIVDNRAGAGGNIGADAVAKAPPDGYTVLMAVHALAISATLYRKLPFDPAKDFAPLSQLTSSTQALVVNPNVPVKTVKELIALAKAQPGKLNYASTGLGTANHLYGETLKSLTGIEIVHVPYKGDAPQTAALLAGEVQMTFTPFFAVLGHVRAGKLRALGVTSTKRSAAFPDVPTMIEAGVADFVFTGWLGALAPAGAPAEIVARLSSELVRILFLPDIRERLPGWGYEPVGSTSEQFAATIRGDIARYAKVIKEARVPLVD